MANKKAPLKTKRTAVQVPLKGVDYKDTQGRIFRVLLPETSPDSDAHKGIVIGPPALDTLGLPSEAAVRLNNQLHARRLFTYEDVKRRKGDVFGALQAALRVDSQRVISLYDSDKK